MLVFTPTLPYNLIEEKIYLGFSCLEDLTHPASMERELSSNYDTASSFTKKLSFTIDKCSYTEVLQTISF